MAGNGIKEIIAKNVKVRKLRQTILTEIKTTNNDKALMNILEFVRKEKAKIKLE
jgi:hypothetical protein